jgi:hypothetical protein
MEDISASVASSVVEDKRVVVVEHLGLMTAAGANAEAAAAVSKRVSRYFIVVVPNGFAPLCSVSTHLLPCAKGKQRGSKKLEQEHKLFGANARPIYRIGSNTVDRYHTDTMT